jgi:hypothetical protein
VLVQEGEIVTIGRAQLGNDKRISRQQMRLEAQARRLIVTVVRASSLLLPLVVIVVAWLVCVQRARGWIRVVMVW